VLIEGFDRNTKALRKVTEFDVKTDRALLADLGQTFLVSRKLTAARKRSADLDLWAVSDAAERDENGGPPEEPEEKGGVIPPEPEEKGGVIPPEPSERRVELKIRYNDLEQEISRDPSSPGEQRVAEPSETDKVTFVVRNLTKERLGYVLMINGTSTRRQQTGDPHQCLRWILRPGEQHVITGFTLDDEKTQPFKVLSSAESEAQAYTENLGLVHLHVFVAGGEEAKEAEEDPGQRSRSISLRSVTPRAGSQLAQTLEQWQALLPKVKTSPTGRKGRGLIEIDSAAPPTIERSTAVPFLNPELVESCVVRYYRPKGL
jgi:hypothetical protein